MTGKVIGVPIASIRGLTVRYGNFTALQDFSVEVPEGCIGLLGPNGAGKTTFLKALLGFIEPAAGSGTVLGLDIKTSGREIRQKLGYMPEQDCHIPGMTGVGFVAYAGELSGMPKEQALRRAHEVLEYCGLGEARYRNVETYSTGMKQRIKLAQALVHGPKLLLLDEPTNGLDPNGRIEMLNLIKDVSHGKGISVLVSSHLLPDIEKTCDEVIVLMQGHMKDQGRINDMKSIQGHPVDVELKAASEEFVVEVEKRGLKLIEHKRTSYRFQTQTTLQEALKIILSSAHDSNSQVRGFEIAERSLEEVFLEAIS